MKHIKTYQLFEKMGMPTGLSENGDAIFDKVIERYRQMLSNYKNNDTIHVDLTGPDYPNGILTINLEIRINNPVIDSGGGTDSKVIYNEDGTIDANMNIDIAGDDFTELQYEIDRDKLRSEIRGTIYHELTHLIEIYVRHTTGGLELENIDTMLMTKVGDIVRDKVHLPTSIRNFFFLVYLAQAHEVSARVPQAYAMTKNIPDARTRQDIITKSNMWYSAEHMIHFSAVDAIADAHSQVSDEYWPTFKTQLSDIITIILTRVDDQAKQYLMLMHNDDKASAAQVFKSSKRRAIKNATHDIESLMHEWEGIIHRAGAKLKRKLSKVITAEL